MQKFCLTTVSLARALGASSLFAQAAPKQEGTGRAAKADTNPMKSGAKPAAKSTSPSGP